MSLFLMLVLTVIVIAAVVWLYLYLSRRALDNSMSDDNAAKPLIRSSRTTDGKAWENPVSAGATSPAATDSADASSDSAAAAEAPAKGSGSSKGTKSGKGGGKTSKSGAKATKGAAATGSSTSSSASGKGGKASKASKGGKSDKSGKSGKSAKAASGTPAKAPDGPLFAAPSGAKDKLTDIKGIGPVAERQLNEQGITTFAQIAGLSASDVKRIDDYMPFSDRQIRDWQKQAKKKA